MPELGTPPFTDHQFAFSLREETVTIVEGEPRKLMVRSETGFSRTTIHGDQVVVRASDSSKGVGDCDRPFPDDLSEHAPAGHSLRELLEGERGHLRIRTVSETRWVATETAEARSWVRFHVVERSGLGSVVATDDTFRDDLRRLAPCGTSRAIGETEIRDLPVLWSGGSAAVFFHEIVGHRSVHPLTPLVLPESIRVSDQPGRVPWCLEIDDVGRELEETDFSSGPTAFRRQSHLDLPMRRMTNLVVTGSDEAPDPPPEHLDVELLAGADYDWLRDEVVFHVAIAHVVSNGQRSRVAPFATRRCATELAGAILQCGGPAARYPGVICSDEGQRLPVGSFAPELLMLPFGTR